MQRLQLTDPSVFAFIALPCALVALYTWGVRRASLRDGLASGAATSAALLALTSMAFWMAITWTAASRGLLLAWDRTPPPFAFVVAGVLVLAAVKSFGPTGTRLARYTPLWVLVAVQSFRLPLELAMHRMYEHGVMPVEMSYSGRNWDIVTGASAMVLAVLVYTGRCGRSIVLAWNVIGLLLLLNVVVVAILGTPRFLYFGPEHVNIWILYPPFVWLPAVLVLAALVGHLLIFRAFTRAPA